MSIKGVLLIITTLSGIFLPVDYFAIDLQNNKPIIHQYNTSLKINKFFQDAEGVLFSLSNKGIFYFTNNEWNEIKNTLF